MAIELSLCMIVKNEEKNLDNCLKSVRGIFDEINIVDTGSTDNTIEIAKKYTDRIFYYEWHDDFSAARNFSFSKATKEYIMWLDADDILTAENAQKLKDLKQTLTEDIQYVEMDYHCWIDDDGNPIITQRRERIVRRDANFLWVSPIHEQIDTSGKGVFIGAAITHNHKQDEKSSLDRNFKIIEGLIKSGNRDSQIVKYYGLGLAEEKDFNRALEYLELFVQLNKKNKQTDLRPYKKIHEIYLSMVKNNKALNILKENEHILEGISEYYCILGSYYRDIEKDNSKALEYFLMALECKGDKETLKKSDYYYHCPNILIGEIYFLNNEYKTALEYFRKAYAYKAIEELGNLIVKLDACFNSETKITEDEGIMSQ